MTRAEKILATAAKFPESASLALRCVEDGTSFSSFQRELLEQLADHDNPGRRRVEVGADGYDAFRRAVPDLLVLRGCGRLVGSMSETERAQRTRAAEEAETGLRRDDLLKSIAERAIRRVPRAGNNVDFESRAFASDARSSRPEAASRT